MGKNLSVRFPDWLYDRLSKDATRNERSIGGQVRYLLGLHYEQQGKRPSRNPLSEGSPKDP